MKALSWILMFLAAPVAAFAGPGEHPWSVRFQTGWTSAGDRVVLERSASSSFGNAFVPYEIGDAGEYGIALERRVGRHWGVEAAHYMAEHDTKLSIIGQISGPPIPTIPTIDEEKLTIETTTVGLNRYWREDRRIHVVTGAFVAMSKPEDVTYNTEHARRDKLTFDDDIGVGVRAGILVPFGATERWRFTADGRYLPMIAEPDFPAPDLTLDPTTVSIGIAWTW